MKKKCQVFTPKLYVEKMLDVAGYKGERILGKYVLENSCGEGNILILIVKRYIRESFKKGYSPVEIKAELEEYIIGFEIDETVRRKCILNLNQSIKEYGIPEVQWNIKTSNYLKETLKKKVDFVIGNPPYIAYQEIELKERNFLREEFMSCNKGKFDYCFAFIEKSLRDLSDSGKMVYIVPNSIFKVAFGGMIRNLMLKYLFSIYDYRQSVVFENVLTSPAIIYLNKYKYKKSIDYYDVDNKMKFSITKKNLKEKWIFSANLVYSSESTKIFGDYFKVSNSVATLYNSAFVIKEDEIISENQRYIFGKDFYIEKEILKNAASPRSYSIGRKEYIIFPYKYNGGKLVRFNKIEFASKFPGAYNYLLKFEKELSKRKSDKSTNWFEYGRNQALNYLDQDKLMISSVITKELNCYLLDINTIPYSGFYIVPIGNKGLDYAEQILKSDEFLEYIHMRGINANGISIRCSVKDILNYPIQDI